MSKETSRKFYPLSCHSQLIMMLSWAVTISEGSVIFPAVKLRNFNVWASLAFCPFHLTSVHSYIDLNYVLVKKKNDEDFATSVLTL